MTFLIILAVILIIILFLISFIKIKLMSLSKEFFGTSDFKSAIKNLELEAENTPKTLMGLESTSLRRVEEDFPDLNINELKSITEANIIKCLNLITDEDKKNNKFDSTKVTNWVDKSINDNIKYTDIKIHKTILSRYELKSETANLIFQTALEYVNEKGKKIQTRFQCEYIYVIEPEKVETNYRGLSLNCRNCGAPIKNLGKKFCEYCNCGIIEIVKKVWIFNNIKEF